MSQDLRAVRTRPCWGSWAWAFYTACNDAVLAHWHLINLTLFETKTWLWYKAGAPPIDLLQSTFLCVHVYQESLTRMLQTKQNYNHIRRFIRPLPSLSCVLWPPWSLSLTAGFLVKQLTMSTFTKHKWTVCLEVGLTTQTWQTICGLVMAARDRNEWFLS